MSVVDTTQSAVFRYGSPSKRTKNEKENDTAVPRTGHDRSQSIFYIEI